MIATLHLTNHYHERSGGVATFYRALMQAAEAEGRTIRLVVPGQVDRVEPVGRYGRIYHLRAPRAPFNDRYRVIYPTQFLLAGTKLREILRQERPDVVEICDKYNLCYLGGLLRLSLLPDLRFRPLILGLSCERMDENFATYVGQSALSRWFCRWYMHWIYYPFFDHHIANSEDTAVELVAASRAHAVERAVWVRPMGVDACGFSPQRRSEALRTELLARAGGTPASTLLLYAGRLAPEKNLPLLVGTLRALAGLPRDYRLVLVGEGIARARLETMAKAQTPGRVAFLGHVGHREQLAAIYASSDAFVHPNAREPFGIAPLEAMASGLPLVAPNQGGITSFANESNAWLAPPQPHAFASAIENLMGSAAMRQARIHAGLATAAGFDWKNIAAGHLALYDALYAAFKGERTVVSCAPYFVSTPATKISGAAITAASAIAKAGFRAYLWCKPHHSARLNRQTETRHI